MVALGLSALAACSAADAVERRQVHVDVGSGGASLIASATVEDYRAAPIDLLTPAVPGDPQMTRFLKSYYEIGRAGDTKRVASLFEPSARDDVNDHYPTAQLLSEQFADLRSASLSAVLHWGEYQIGVVQHELEIERGGRRRWSWPHVVRCVNDTCHITDHFANSVLGRVVAAAFANNGDAQVAATAQGEMLPILPAVADAAQKPAADDPIILYLDRAPEQTTLAAKTVVSALTDKLRATSPKQDTFENVADLYSAGTPTSVEVFQRGNEVPGYAYSAYVTWFARNAPWTVSSVYSLGSNVCVAVLKSDKNRAIHLLPLQRVGTGWAIVSDASRVQAWSVLSSISTYQALQRK
jgi:hypothetical protein